jgi:probable phosphoglycerate mutase
MTLFLLVRHGENEYVKKGRMAGRIPGVHLNENGVKQANALAEMLADAPIKAVYSSPLERAMETAAPIAEKASLGVIPREGLVETDIGEWEGQKVKGLSRLKVWRIVQFAPARMRFPGGESFADAQHRVCKELDVLNESHAEDDLVVCVSHSDPIKLAVAYFIGLPLDLFQRLSIGPASITALQIGKAGSRLMNLNYEISFNLPKS